MLTEYRNTKDFLRDLIAIDENKRFALYDIYRNPEQGTYDTMCVGDVDSFINHGRLFRSVEDALARHDVIKSILQLQNNNDIFSAETGEVILNTSDDGALKQHGIVKDKDDNLVLWTLSLSHFEEDVHHAVATAGLFAVQVFYKDGTFLGPNLWDPEELKATPAPAVLFATYHEAEEAIDIIKPMLDEKPHPIDYWLSEDLFRVNLDERCFYRDSSKNLPDFFFDTYAPEHGKQDSRMYKKMKEIVECDEGLYTKSGSHFNIEMVLRTADGEWHFRDDKVLFDNHWFSIEALYPFLGVTEDASLLRAFSIRTETVVLTQENICKYIGRTLASPVFHKWMKDFVDEDTGDTVQIERSEQILKFGDVINEWAISSIEALQKPVVVTFVNEDEEMLRLVQFIVGIPSGCFFRPISSYAGDEWMCDRLKREYLESHTRLTEIGRRRLDKALYGTFDHSHYHSSGTYHITPRDFFEIFKMLAKAGAGYHPMTDVPTYPTNELLEASVLADIRSKHIGSRRPQLSSMATECLEIDYQLHQ